MSNSKVLIVGGGGREHALAWKCAVSSRVDEVLVAPGNAGTALEKKVRNMELPADGIEALAHLAEDEGADLTIIGPEAPLAAGIVDAFDTRGLPCLGPTRQAAQLEASKAFSKEFMQRHDIPTADYAAFRDVDAAVAYIRKLGAPVVIKADGLAAGKGVVLAESVTEAVEAARNMLSGQRFGPAGKQIVVEEFLRGEEASFIALVDGEHVLPLATSQDHKAANDGDTGPNTGGMGAYSPTPAISAALEQRILDEIIRPTVKGMIADGKSYRGFLYAGLMMDTAGNPKVLEFNVRLGDPETQPLLMRLRSDVVDMAQAAVTGQLDSFRAEWDQRTALGVVMAAGGYPGAYNKGDVITGLDVPAAEDTKVFHAGTRLDDNRLLTNGGRVLCVCALGEDAADAQQKAYGEVKKIHWNNAHWRRDIGQRAIGDQG